MAVDATNEGWEASAQENPEERGMTPPMGFTGRVEPQVPVSEAGGTVKGIGHAASPNALEGEIERLTAENARLEKEKLEIEAFAAVASHELFEPLVMIEAYAAMAAERLDAGDEATREDLDQIGRAAARLRHLAEMLLYDARSGSRALRLRNVDCQRLIADVVAMLRPEIEARGVRVEVGELPEVRGEPSLLGGLFTNLLTNALKYGPRSGGVVSVTASRDAAEFQLAVEDDGPPIPEDERARIFEPFRRGRRERRSRGTGLGLAICRRIVERHGGDIGVSTGERGGNRFVVTLPG
jgi:signal transduction histidine kinase